MPCRVGITTDPEERKAYWRNRVVGFSNWRILKTFRSRRRAQQYERRYAEKHGCKAYAGGRETPGRWHVYRFNYTRER